MTDAMGSGAGQRVVRQRADGEHLNAPADVVGRVVVLVRSLGEAEGPVTLSALARNTGLPKSSVHRLLALLEQHGAVGRAGRMYLLGDSLRGLDTGIPHGAELRRVVLPHLVELYDLTTLTVSVAVLRDLEVVYLNRISAPVRALTLGPPYERVPAHQTASGRLMLAHTPDVAARAFQALAHTQSPENANLSQERWDTDLASIRRNGMASVDDDTPPGTSSLAAPVAGRTGRPIAAIEISGRPQEVYQSTTVAQALRRVAKDASATLLRLETAAIHANSSTTSTPS